MTDILLSPVFISKGENYKEYSLQVWSITVIFHENNACSAFEIIWILTDEKYAFKNFIFQFHCEADSTNNNNIKEKRFFNIQIRNRLKSMMMLCSADFFIRILENV